MTQQQLTDQARAVILRIQSIEKQLSEWRVGKSYPYLEMLALVKDYNRGTVYTNQITSSYREQYLLTLEQTKKNAQKFGGLLLYEYLRTRWGQMIEQGNSAVTFPIKKYESIISELYDQRSLIDSDFVPLGNFQDISDSWVNAFASIETSHKNKLV